jgi:dipeptidyl aminopeptidase/acylaminoacyl peptidase
LIFHGVHDDIVPIDYSRAFAASHPNVRLVELESDHELLSSPGQNSDVLDRIVAEATDFLLA